VRDLVHAFFEQFFADDASASEAQRRQTIFYTGAFLAAPGVFLMLELFPEFQSALIRERLGRGPVGYVDDLRAWIGFLFTTYSMAAAGLVTVLAWDSLTFGRRDAMVLGPLPLRQRTILAAKLGALGALLLAGALPITTVNAAMFAMETAGAAGIVGFVQYFIAIFLATFGAAFLGFALVVCARATVSLAGGSDFAARCGPPLQFLCVVCLLSLVIFCPFVLRVPFLSAGFTNAMPPAWFVGVFEQLRGSPRAFDPAFPFLMLARRAAAWTSMAAGAAVAFSVVEFRRQMRFSLAPPASPGILGSASIGRWLARLIAGGNQAAAATADFVLLTLARHRARMAPIAIHAALAATIVIAGLSNDTRTLGALFRPRTALLWMPLVVGFWMTIGLRRSFLASSEPGGEWTFRVNGTASDVWPAVRAAMIGFLVPRTLALTATLIPLIGWRLTAWHAVVVGVLMVLLAELAALGIDHVPFTRRAAPAPAAAARWTLCIAGMFAFAYVPARLVLLFGPSAPCVVLVAVAGATSVGLELFGRRRSARRSEPQPVDQDTEEVGDSGLAVLGLTAASR